MFSLCCFGSKSTSKYDKQLTPSAPLLKRTNSKHLKQSFALETFAPEENDEPILNPPLIAETRFLNEQNQSKDSSLVRGKFEGYRLQNLTEQRGPEGKQANFKALEAFLSRGQIVLAHFPPFCEEQPLSTPLSLEYACQLTHELYLMTSDHLNRNGFICFVKITAALREKPEDPHFVAEYRFEYRRAQTYARDEQKACLLWEPSTSSGSPSFHVTPLEKDSSWTKQQHSLKKWSFQRINLDGGEKILSLEDPPMSIVE